MVDAVLPAVNRRTLLGSGVAATLSAAGYRRVLGANDRVGLGFIGFGLIGKRHVLDFQGFPDVDLVAVAEVHKGRLAEAAALMGAKTREFGDFRGLIDDRDIDAVIVSTPDHWHTLMTMMACAAGKDVYVEKPLSLFIREGRWMVDVARRHHRVVQVGTQQRSGPHYLKARELIRGGHIGRVVAVRMWTLSDPTPKRYSGVKRRLPIGLTRRRKTSVFRDGKRTLETWIDGFRGVRQRIPFWIEHYCQTILHVIM